MKNVAYEIFSLGGTKSIGSRVFHSLWADEVYGGTLIGVTYVAKSGLESEEREREKLKLLRFYTWPKDKEKVMEVGPCVFYFWVHTKFG